MKDAVLIKSLPHGINLIMREDASYDEIIEELAEKFREGRNFFKDASMAVSVEGRALTQEEEVRLVDTIRENCDLKIFCVIGKDEMNNKNYVRAVKQLEEKMSEKDDGQFFKGNLTDNQVIETTKTLVVIGDVNPGCAVISSKNIIILGGLYGEAFAGDENKNNHFVLALEMEPERLRIGDYKYKPAKKSKWGIRQKIQPKVAYVKNEEIVLEVPDRTIMSQF